MRGGPRGLGKSLFSVFSRPRGAGLASMPIAAGADHILHGAPVLGGSLLRVCLRACIAGFGVCLAGLKPPKWARQRYLQELRQG